MEHASPVGIQPYQPSPSTFPPAMMPSHQQQPAYPGGPVLSHSQSQPPPMMSGAYGSSPLPLQQQPQQQQYHRPEEQIHVAPPVLTQSPTQMTARDRDLRAARSTAEFAVREYMTLQRRRYGGAGSTVSVAGGDPALEERIRRQAGMAGASLRAVRERVVDLAREAEAHRWRKWVLGGILASFVPLVKRLFRRPRGDDKMDQGGSSSGITGTEYAFRKSKTLIARILGSVHGKSGLASVAFFVFAVLYVFSNEVSLRVAKTVSKRLKRLTGKVESGEGDVQERDLEVLSGWRWRVLAWSE